jgi:hypothetical protein
MEAVMPVGRGNIEEQLRAIREGDHWWDRREVRDLPLVLQHDERICGIVLGRVLRRPWRAKQWLVLVTTERLLLLRQERFGRTQLDIALSHVTSITHSARLFATEIGVHTVDRRHRIRIAKAGAVKFIGALSAVMQSLALVRAGSEPGQLPPDLARRSDVERVEQTVGRLEADVERLQQQVDFLEDLLRTRTADALPPGSLGAQSAPLLR